ncbi:MAG: Holliday junction branch migration protein RuvA, partial [Clostridia bacterium]|nr:Holliday junction branch migration protein RuvA [Clostridia bacterium]
MTGSLRGVVEQVDAGSVRLRLGAVAVDVLVPPVVAQALVARTGESVELEVVVYLQGAGMTGFRPVTFGFATALERQLFELLTTVDGVGPRAALRMLAEPAEVGGRAIAAADAEVLKRLPG